MKKIGCFEEHSWTSFSEKSGVKKLCLVDIFFQDKVETYVCPTDGPSIFFWTFFIDILGP